jgi:sec-independent protein translocase protein TatC
LKKERNPEKELELLDHLGELRGRLFRSIVFIVIGMAVAWIFFDQLYALLLQPAINVLSKTGMKFLQTTFVQGFTLRMQVSLIGGLILAAPFWTAELWLFIAPGLTKQERKALFFVAPLSIVLFALGVFLCFIAMPRALDWFVSLAPPNTELRPDVARTLVFFVQMYLAFGLMFELPIVMMFLAKIGLINTRLMIRFWREATVAIAVLAAVMTPSNDAFTMLMMAVPMVALYFLSISLVRMVESRG